jgi:hypothetical protein
VLWEKTTPIDVNQWKLSGYTDSYLRVSASFSSPCHNKIMEVHITGIKLGELVGEITHPLSQFDNPQDTL